MQIIDLNSNHSFKNFIIVDQEEVIDPEHGTCYKIEYRADNRIFDITKCVFIIIITLRLSFISQDFRDFFKSSFFTTEVLSPISLEKYLWNRIHENPSLEQLYLDAMESYKLLVSETMTPRSHLRLKIVPEGAENWPANVTPFCGKITIKLGTPENKLLCYVIFELINLKRNPVYQKIEKKVEDKEILNADDYARENEVAEYETNIIYRNVIVEAMKTNPSLEAIQRKTPTPLEPYLKIQNRNGHTDHYRRQFYIVNMRNMFKKITY